MEIAKLIKKSKDQINNVTEERDILETENVKTEYISKQLIYYIDIYYLKYFNL